MAAQFDQYSDVIDSRDVIERLAELHDEMDAAGTAVEKDEIFGQLNPLELLNSAGENATDDWHHGATLIRDSHFREYAIELAREIDAELMDKVSARGYAIDWDMYARDLQTGYMDVEFRGVTYWIAC